MDRGWRMSSFHVAHQALRCILLVLHHLWAIVKVFLSPTNELLFWRGDSTLLKACCLLSYPILRNAVVLGNSSNDSRQETNKYVDGLLSFTVESKSLKASM